MKGTSEKSNVLKICLWTVFLLEIFRIFYLLFSPPAKLELLKTKPKISLKMFTSLANVHWNYIALII